MTLDWGLTVIQASIRHATSPVLCSHADALCQSTAVGLGGCKEAVLQGCCWSMHGWWIWLEERGPWQATSCPCPPATGWACGSPLQPSTSMWEGIRCAGLPGPVYRRGVLGAAW